jgi:hypothetical protein
MTPTSWPGAWTGKGLGAAAVFALRRLAEMSDICEMAVRNSGE